ncbi:hypothetical protein ACTOWJ_11315 [Lysobacter sp. CA199]
MFYKPDQGIDAHDLDMVAHASDERVRARTAVYAVDTAMRKYYAILKADLTTHLDPVIVVNNDSKGGEYTLIHDGLRQTVQPVSDIFELVKSISHIPLAIFCVIAPYLKDSETKEWVAPIKDLAATLRNAQKHLAASDLPAEAGASSARILDAGLKFIAQCLEDDRFSIKGFEKFSGSVAEDIKTNMRHAARVQVEGVSALMKRWRKEVGEARWRDLYTVVLSIWTTSVRNQNTIIIRGFMNPANVDSHLIDIPTAQTPHDPIAVALDNLARIVQDNVAAEMVFPKDPILADSLKGTEDLLSNEIDKLIQCPHMKP